MRNILLSNRQWTQYLKQSWTWPIPSPPCSLALPSTPASIKCSRTSKLRWGITVQNHFSSSGRIYLPVQSSLARTQEGHVSGKIIVSFMTLKYSLCPQDLWLPYFNVTTDITASAMRVHQDGKWQLSWLQGPPPLSIVLLLWLAKCVFSINANPHIHRDT